MINVAHVSKSFGTTPAVSDISFHIEGGSHLILLGTSGCGKTTTLRMINRLIEPTSGTITINGKDAASLSPEELRRGIGYVLQHNSLFPHYTVAENIAIVPQLLKWDKNKIQQRIHTLLDKLHLPASYLALYPSALSGGQQQRVNIARALAADPDILLMDEPFGALDPITRAGIRKEFSELDELKRKTILMVTHDVQEAFELGDQICLMDKGRIMQLGTPADLLFRPASDFVRSFLAESHLQLSLKTITLHDIWPLLTEVGNNATDTLPVSAHSSVWSILQQTGNTNGKTPGILKVTNNDDQVKYMDSSTLLNAVRQYKTQ